MWLPPKVWFQGSQSTSTGGSSAEAGKHCRICCWLAHSMRCVLITPLGSLVEPEVNRNLAMVSGPTCACAASTGGAWHGGQQVGEGQRRRGPRCWPCGQHHRSCRPARWRRWRGRSRWRWRRTPGPASARRGCGAACRSPARRWNRPARSARRARRRTSRPGRAAGARGRCPTGSPPAARPTGRMSSSACAMRARCASASA